MCMGIPMRLVSVDGIAGQASCDGQTRLIDLSLVTEARPGDWVLTHLGTAREVIDARRAAQIAAALEGLAALMRGDGPGAAFADLDARAPALPPHLAAARAAGKTQA